MKRRVCGLFGLGLWSFASAASAQTPAAEPAASPASPTVNAAPQESAEPVPRHWCGWQGLAVDGAAAALGLTSLALLRGDVPQGYEERERLAGAIALGAAVAYGVGSPAVHWLHERPWQALGSLGLRVGLPVLGGAVGLSECARGLLALRQVGAHFADRNAHDLDGGAQLRFGAAQLAAPVQNFGGLSDVDLRAVLRHIRHVDSS